MGLDERHEQLIKGVNDKKSWNPVTKRKWARVCGAVLKF